MSAEDIEYIGDYKEFPTKESALDWLDNYLSLDERNNLIRALEQEPCEDCISRQAALDLCERFNGSVPYSVLSSYDTLPPVTPLPKIGRWIIIVDDCKHFIAKCSECGKVEDSRMISKYQYCHCGAKMVGVTEE